jgi:predicted membrane protein
MKKIITGVIIILAGVILLFYNLGFLPYSCFRIVFSWQLLLVAIGATMLADKRGNNKDAGIILIFVGLAFLATKALLFWVPYLLPDINIKGLTLSICIIAIGIYLLAKSRRSKSKQHFFEYNHCRRYHKGDFESMPFTDIFDNDAGYIKREYVFTGAKERINTEIKRVNIEAVFSGVEVDFSQTELSSDVKNIHIKVSSVFSGVILYIPEEWEVLIQKTGVLGGFSDKRFAKKRSNSNEKLVILELEAVFGGGEVKYI